MLVGVDLLWVRPGINGGTESVIRNLLKAFGELGEESFLLFVSRDNAGSFRAFEEYPNIKLHVCNVDSANPSRRVLWQSRYQDDLARKLKVDIFFSPIYSMPRHRQGGIPYVAVIHDMQALHYPEYFGRVRNAYFRYAWKRTCLTADRVITISDYCKEDIEGFCPRAKGKVVRIYDPVDIPVAEETTAGETGNGPGTETNARKASEDNRVDLKDTLQKYGLRAYEYDYCVSSLLPHKNLDTLLKMKAAHREDTTPLLISGVGGRAEEFNARVKELGLEERVIQTGFVSNEERNALYAGCRLFLFPSVFEGFGMPPIEAFAFGKRVVMTQEACLREVTAGKAVYVSDPYDPEDWAARVKEALSLEEHVITFPQYSPRTIAAEYLKVFREIGKK